MPHYTDLLYSNTEAYNAKRLFSPKVEVFIKSKDEDDSFSITETLGNVEDYSLVNQRPTALKSVDFTLSEGFNSGTCTINLYDRNREYANLLYNFDQGEEVEVEQTEEIITTTTTTSNPVASQSESPCGYEPQATTVEEKAWLDTIAFCEGTAQYIGGKFICRPQNGYNIIFTFKPFSSYQDHPRQRIRSGSLVSSAAGRYQFLDTTWDDFVRRFPSLSLTNFQPDKQDRAAIKYTELGHPRSSTPNSNALGFVKSRNVREAVYRCNGIWASFPLPGGDTKGVYGQGAKRIELIEEVFNSRLKYYEGKSEPQNKAKESITETIVTTKTVQSSSKNKLVGASIFITVTLERPSYLKPVTVTYAFIETGMDYDEANREVLIYGKTAGFLLNQKILNTAYTNITLYELFKRFTRQRSIQLEMEDDGVEYEYFPVVGKSLWRALVDEARRRGYFLSLTRSELELLESSPIAIGSKLSVYLPAKASNNEPLYSLMNGVNAPNNVKFSYRIEDTNDGDSIEKSERNTESESAAEINMYSGLYDSTAITKVYTNFPEATEDTEKTLDGTQMGANEPVYKDEYRKTQLEVDALNRANLVRLNGINMECVIPMDAELLQLLPNNYVQTLGYEVIRNNSAPVRRNINSRDVKNGLNRIFVIDSIRHSISSDGFETSLSCKSPIKEQYTI